MSEPQEALLGDRRREMGFDAGLWTRYIPGMELRMEWEHYKGATRMWSTVQPFVGARRSQAYRVCIDRVAIW